MEVSARNCFRTPQNILQRATHLLSDTGMGQGLFTNRGGLHFNLDHVLPTGKGSRANNKYTRLPSCRGTRGTEPKRKLYLYHVWMGKREERREAAASLYVQQPLEILDRQILFLPLHQL